jgi:hypothetical protein
MAFINLYQHLKISPDENYLFKEVAGLQQKTCRFD